MGKTVKKTACLAIMAVLVLLLSACSLEASVESMFVLPRVPVEYSGLQEKLNTLLAEGYEYLSPIGGNNIQPVQMIDLNGDGEEEAVVFFRRATDEQPLKIVLFRANGDSFEPYCTIASGGTSVESVSYRDYNGDGVLELTVGWRISTDVQTVAVYALANGEATTLMQSSYVRFAVDDLDGDGRFDLLLVRTDQSGRCLAEHYCWQEGTLGVSGSCHLSSTMPELSRGSIVCGKLDSQTKAAFITGVNSKNEAMTDLVICRGDEISCVAEDPTTGMTDIRYPFGQLFAQDINGDGSMEIPHLVSGGHGVGGVFSWVRYDRHGNSIQVADTYHNLAENWFLILGEDWNGRLAGTMRETINGGTVVSVLVDGEVLLRIYTFTGESREQDAESEGRTPLVQRANSTYAVQILPPGKEQGVTLEWVKSHFHLIAMSWTAEN